VHKNILSQCAVVDYNLNICPFSACLKCLQFIFSDMCEISINFEKEITGNKTVLIILMFIGIFVIF